MPNHVHGILVICESGAQGAANAPTLGLVMRAFKSLSGIGCNRLPDRTDMPFWQRNYYEHVIRDDDDLNRIRDYIVDNPARWAEDAENPAQWDS